MQNVQWGLRAIRWFDAECPDAASVSVGILDTGIDAGHPDLADVEITYDHPGTRAEDIVGHGTHVAGIVGAETNNAVGIGRRRAARSTCGRSSPTSSSRASTTSTPTPLPTPCAPGPSPG